MTSFPEQIRLLKDTFLKELQEASSLESLFQLKSKYLGKKGPIQSLMLQMKDLSKEERPLFGKQVNALKEEFASHLDNTLARVKQEEMERRFIQERIDPTLPGRRKRLGREHPLRSMLSEITDILIGMGFSVQLGPDVDTDYYNFEGLNFAEDHPARDMQDTFYLGSDLLLRTHTSNTQVHAMQTYTPPLRIVAPGRAFRNEDISARSHVFFHQIEGFYIDRNVTFSDLFATLNEFLNKLLGEVTTRFRPSYFPFVEPGVEVDIRCTSCRGKGCRVCKRTGWLEILGAGMIHPNVLEKGGIDPEVFSGYAWGMGIERLAMLRYNVKDIRLFTENDERFLSQFP